MSKLSTPKDAPGVLSRQSSLRCNFIKWDWLKCSVHIFRSLAYDITTTQWQFLYVNCHVSCGWYFVSLLSFNTKSVARVFFYEDLVTRYGPRFFDQAWHQIMSAYIGNKHFFTKSCHRQTYQKYLQTRQKLGTFLGKKKFTKFHL